MRVALPRTLTARLVAVAVLLVAVAALLIALTTTLAMRGYLYGQLDDDVRGALGRSYADPPINFHVERDEPDAGRQGPAGRHGHGDVLRRLRQR